MKESVNRMIRTEWKNGLMLVMALALFSCKQDRKDALFSYVKPSESGIYFSNTIIENDSINPGDCLNCFNGGGVGIGDFNGDQLPDVVFGGNQVSSALYLNKGGLKFEDVTEVAGLTTHSWVTGVTVIDINSDGWDDIYMSVGGINCEQLCSNLLFVNQGIGQDGVPVFLEQAEAYGLDDGKYSQHAVFFDYDLDGDLDVFIARNTNNKNFNRNSPRPKKFLPEHLTDLLLRNDSAAGKDHPVFTDVSKELGIEYKGYGLGLGINDFNGDNLVDVYVANDFITEDLLYINRAHKDSLNPRFSEENKDYFWHLTENGMGMDIADINDDGHPDVLVLDMLPEHYVRKKRVLGSMNYNSFLVVKNNDYSVQYMRNTLQLHNGHLNGQPVKSSEVGLMYGISSTDWSWAPLMVDFDNDGDKDIFITNGYVKDLIDRDYMNYTMNKSTVFIPKDSKGKEYLEMLPPIKEHNYFYEQKGAHDFRNVSDHWVQAEPSLSKGVAYADLDLDGDLDLLVSNLNAEAYLLENMADRKRADQHYLRVRLNGPQTNRHAIGAKLTLWSEGKPQHQFQSVVRGYLSSVEPVVHFGLHAEKADSLVVTWPGGAQSRHDDLRADTVYSLSFEAARRGQNTQRTFDKTFKEVAGLIEYQHEENNFNEYEKQPLLMRQYSQSGPCMAAADIDGMPGEELFIGGSVQKPGTLWAQDESGTYRIKQALDSIHEDTDALFADLDQDGDLDLYVCSGGTEFSSGSNFYQDRVYLNDGKGHFNKAEEVLPEAFQSTQFVRANDIDGDGDLDLFVGARVKPGKYPEIPESYFLINNNGKFIKECPAGICAEGMLTDAMWLNLDGDQAKELVITGEFMGIRAFDNQNGQWSEIPLEFLDASNKAVGISGWWNCLAAGDFDGDGDLDLLAGNQGENAYIKPEPNYPIYLYNRDLDNNGSLDPALGQYFDHQGKKVLFPVHTKDDLKKQFPETTLELYTYEQFSQVDFETLLKIEDLEAETMKAEVFSSSYFENLGEGRFKIHTLPKDCQVAPVNEILTEDFNGDGKLDALLVGNDFSAESIYGRFDALSGIYLMNTGDGFDAVPSRTSGFYVPSQSNHLLKLTDRNGRRLILATQNNEKMKVFEQGSGLPPGVGLNAHAKVAVKKTKR